MVYGTSYFPSRWDAVKYYSVLGFKSPDVKEMIKKGVIHIGKPPGLNSMRRAVAHNDQGKSKRYFIHEDTKIG